MAEGIKDTTHAFLQRGSKMRKRAPSHPSPVRDMTSVYDTGCGKRKRFDAKGITTMSMTRAPPVEVVSSKLYKLKNQQKANTWRIHQSVQHKELGRCKWDKCPAKKIPDPKRGRPKATYMHCKECTAVLRKVMYLCNNKIGGDIAFCHIKHHNKFQCKKYLAQQEALKEKNS